VIWRTVVAESTELTGAVEVWRAANQPRGLAPTSDQVERVRAKLADPDALVLLALDGEDRIRGMALAERGRVDGGAGEIVPGWGHLSMIFVEPQAWGHGAGSALLRELDRQAQARGWVRLSLWTRTGNERARRLYERAGYRLSGRRGRLSTGDEIVQYERAPL